MAVPVGTEDNGDKGLRHRKKRSDSRDEDSEDKGAFELEKLVAKEVDEWRTKVGRTSHVLGARRQSKDSLPETVNSLDEVSGICQLSNYKKFLS
jgi:hypothetical protein